MTVKLSKSIQKVPTGYHLAYSDKTMLPQGINQREMAQPFDSSSFRLIQAHTGCPRSIWYFKTSILVTILIKLTKACYHSA